MGKLNALDNSKTDKGKMQISIKKDKEDKVLKFVTTAISLLESGGNAHKFEYKFEQYVYALSNLIKIPGIKNLVVFQDRLKL